MMAELKRCPECGGVATVIHMYDTYDRADFGWDAGCGRYRAGDGLHTKKMKVSGLPSKAKATEAWNRRADNAWPNAGINAGEIGKTVFLTREEAEAALEAMKND